MKTHFEDLEIAVFIVNFEILSESSSFDTVISVFMMEVLKNRPICCSWWSNRWKCYVDAAGVKILTTMLLMLLVKNQRKEIMMLVMLLDVTNWHLSNLIQENESFMVTSFPRARKNQFPTTMAQASWYVYF